MRERHWFVWIGSLCVAIVALWIWVRHGDALYYRWVELPAVRRVLLDEPGIIMRGVQNFATPGEPEELRVVLRIAGKGDLALRQPFRTSFTGGGSIVMQAIGPCETPVLGLDSDPVFADLQLQRIRDVAQDYDVIYERVRARGWCHSGYGMEPHEP